MERKKFKGSKRYYVKDGSDSGHSCCFKFSVIDKISYCICETDTKAYAEKICNLLNGGSNDNG